MPVLNFSTAKIILHKNQYTQILHTPAQLLIQVLQWLIK